MDVKSCYLHPLIKEEIYLEQQTGFDETDRSGNKLVCKLNKLFYGLKQADKNWYEEVASFPSYNKTLVVARMITVFLLKNKKKECCTLF